MTDISEEALEREQEQTIMVRIVEWMEWMPAEQRGPLAMTNGLTSFKTLKDEKLIDLGVSGTGQNYEWEEEVECDVCEGTGKALPNQFEQPEETPPLIGGELPDCEPCEGTGKHDVTKHFGLYAFQAVLAQGMSDSLASTLIAAQAEPMEQELQRDKEAGRDRRDDLVVIQRGKPNRNDRRGGKAQPKRKHRG